MATLRLLAAGSGPGGQIGELLCCAYTPDGGFVLTGGWDGHLRVWEATHGAHVSDFQASDKPISACAVSPDGKSLASGSLDGMLAVWDAVTHLPKVNFLAHTRPISAIVYGPDGRGVATASWDNTLNLWLSLGRVQESRTLGSHRDIVAGCRFTPDGQAVLSWSYDKQVQLWDTVRGKSQREFNGHADRVLAGAMAPDGQWAATGGRDGVLKLWNLQAGAEAASVDLPFEIRGCVFLRDGAQLVAIDKNGRLTLHELPSLRKQSELATRLPVQCLELSPSGGFLALPCANGTLHIVAVEGFDDAPLIITATRTVRRTATPLQRLFGRSQLIYVYQCVCPVCRHAFEPSDAKPGQPTTCPKCNQHLRLSTVMRTAEESEK